jgi:hypothetical protein
VAAPDAARERAAVQYSSRWSRLERMIRRLSGQQACLEHVATLVADMPGPVLEVGLGKGRTYDHLRRLLPEREIYAFDREVHAFKDCIPPDDRLFLGEFHATIPAALERFRGQVALANADFGRSDAAADAELAAWLGPKLSALVRDGGYVLSDQPLSVDRLVPQALPDGAEEGRIHFYRAG